MVKLTCPRSTSRGIWHSLGVERRSRNSHPTSSTITSRTHNVGQDLIKRSLYLKSGHLYKDRNLWYLLLERFGCNFIFIILKNKISYVTMTLMSGGGDGRFSPFSVSSSKKKRETS